MELLGKSLEALFQEYNKRLTLKTVCSLGIDIFKRIEFMHNKNHIHRDIKPDNFTIGYTPTNNELTDNKTDCNSYSSRSDSIYVIDLGLAKKYRSASTKIHNVLKTGKSLTGTARYCSINTHKGLEQSRRDDLESILYMLIYFLKGSLPWQGLICGKDQNHYDVIYKKKCQVSSVELVGDLPSKFLFKLEQFIEMLDYVKNLKYEEDPDYQKLYSLIFEMMKENCNEEVYKFEWSKKYLYTNSKILDGLNDKGLKQTNSLIMNKGNLSNNLIEKDDSAINMNVRNSINHQMYNLILNKGTK